MRSRVTELLSLCLVLGATSLRAGELRIRPNIGVATVEVLTGEIVVDLQGGAVVIGIDSEPPGKADGRIDRVYEVLLAQEPTGLFLFRGQAEAAIWADGIAIAPLAGDRAFRFAIGGSRVPVEMPAGAVVEHGEANGFVGHIGGPRSGTPVEDFHRSFVSFSIEKTDPENIDPSGGGSGGACTTSCSVSCSDGTSCSASCASNRTAKCDCAPAWCGCYSC